ncbi:MAG: QueT transporter family protein [Clostridia bacterium]|nr:QueT transporter family protein [Clostridia bacterium]
MNEVFTTKRLCRAGVIAALYVVLTYAFMSFAFGPFQVRPAEALCILPLFFPEAVPALFVGCMLSNIVSAYSVYDIVFGSLATLLAALGTYCIGRISKRDGVRIVLGGLFPVLVNAFAIPLIIVFLFGDTGTYATVWTAYFANVGIFLLTQTVWVYGLGAPLYFAIKRLWKK